MECTNRRNPVEATAHGGRSPGPDPRLTRLPHAEHETCPGVLWDTHTNEGPGSTVLLPLVSRRAASNPDLTLFIDRLLTFIW